MSGRQRTAARRAWWPAAALLLVPLGLSAQVCQMAQEGGDLWTCTYNDNYAARPRLQVIGHGAVTVHGATSQTFIIQVKVSLHARNREFARNMFQSLPVMRRDAGPWLVIETPGGVAESDVTVLAPKLEEARIGTTDGAVEVTDIDGPLRVETGANVVKVDRIHGNCYVQTGGGDVEVGQVDGSMRAITAAGAIRVESVGGVSFFKTNAGSVDAKKLGGQTQIETGAGTVHVGWCGGSVNAINRGGPIIVDQSSGVVTANNVAGAIRIGGAAGIQCQSAPGGIQLTRITGPMSVTTEMGNILANLFGGRLAESLLATGNGDITVVVPSNIGVTIRAQNQMTDRLQRISSDYPQLKPQPRGTWLVAEGRLNGGGPLLQISAASGTIFIKRQ